MPHYTYSFGRGFVVTVDPGAFASVEIVIGGGHSGAGRRKETNGYAPASPYTSGPSPKLTPLASASPHAKRPPLAPLNSPPPSPLRSPSEKETRHAYTRERERERASRKMAEEREQRQREEARLAEARRIAEEARRRQLAQMQAEREERRRERMRRARALAEAWRVYEARWAVLSRAHSQRGFGLHSALAFDRIPWPVMDPPRHPSELRVEAIRKFLLSSAHSPDVPPRDRIRAALRRWHPDKFTRVLSLVIESDREAVVEGMGIVARCLNELLEKENQG